MGFVNTAEPPRDLPNPSLIDQEHESVPEDEELELAAEDDQGLDLLAELDELGPEEEYQTASQTEVNTYVTLRSLCACMLVMRKVLL